MSALTEMKEQYKSIGCMQDGDTTFHIFRVGDEGELWASFDSVGKLMHFTTGGPKPGLRMVEKYRINFEMNTRYLLGEG